MPAPDPNSGFTCETVDIGKGLVRNGLKVTLYSRDADNTLDVICGAPFNELLVKCVVDFIEMHLKQKGMHCTSGPIKYSDPNFHCTIIGSPATECLHYKMHNIARDALEEGAKQQQPFKNSFLGDTLQGLVEGDAQHHTGAKEKSRNAEVKFTNRFKNLGDVVKEVEIPEEYPSDRISRTTGARNFTAKQTISQATAFEREYESKVVAFALPGASNLENAGKLVEIEDALLACYRRISSWFSDDGEKQQEMAEKMLDETKILASSRAKTAKKGRVMD